MKDCKTRRINLGIIVRDYKMGGVQRFISHLTAKLNKNRFRLFLFVLDNSEIDSLSIINSKDCSEIGINPYTKNNPLSLFWLKQKMIRMDINISFILRADIMAAVTAKIFNIHNLIITERGGRINRLGKGYQKILMRLLDNYLVSKICFGAISNSLTGKEALIKNGFNDKMIRVIPNGIECVNKNQIIKKRIDNYITIGFLGRLEKFKNVKVLIKAFKNLDPNKYRLKIGGYGSEKENLLELVNKYKLNDRIVFVGFVSNLEEFFYDIDIAVIPSKADGTESFPNVLLEYWKYNKPVISSDIKAIKDITENMNYTVCFKSNDHYDLANKIKILASNNALRILNINEAIKKLKEYYDIKIIIEQYHNYFLKNCI